MPSNAVICCQCKIATDDYNRANSDNPGSSWSEFAGTDWDIDNNELLVGTTSGTDQENVALQFNTPHPGGASAPARVRVKFKVASIDSSGTNIPDSAGVEFAAPVGERSNVDAVVFYHVASGCWKLDLSLAGGGSQQQLPGLTLNEWHTLEVCYQPGSYAYQDDILRARVTLASGRVYGDQLAHPAGQSSGGAYVNLLGGTGTRYDDFYFGWMRDEVEPCKAVCPDCNTPCFVEDDNYDRADSTDLGCKWNEISGVWQIVSNELKLVSGGPGIALCTVHHPQGKTHHHVTCDLYAGTGLKPRIIVNSNSAGSSYHWAELEWNGTNTLTLRVGKNANTLATTTTTFTGAAWVPLTVCFNGVAVIATTSWTTLRANSTAVANGKYVGLAGNSSGSGERFDNFEFQKHRDTDNPACPDCPVEGQCTSTCCDTDPPPYFLYANIGAGGWFGAAFCDDFFGEYVLINEDDGFPQPPVAGCEWKFVYFPDGSGPGDGGQAFMVKANLYPSSVDPDDIPVGKCIWQVQVIYSQVGMFLNQAVYRTAPFDEGGCAAFPFTLTKVSEVSSNCDGTMPDTIELYA